MNEVMRNARTFLELIQAAKTETAGCWNKEALQRAMQWAEYFEGVHRKLHTKPGVVMQFNRGLQIINSQPGASPGPSPITFDNFQQSRRLILKILLQNPNLNSELYRQVLDHYSSLPASADGTTGTDMLNKDATDCAHAKAVRSTLLKIKALTSAAVARTKQTQEKATCQKNHDGLSEVEIQTDAAILCQHIMHHLRVDPPSDGTCKYLHDRLHQIALKPLGIDIISQVASSSLHNRNNTGTDGEQAETAASVEIRCKQFVSGWLAENRTKYKTQRDSVRR